jgi:hypothetical protein
LAASHLGQRRRPACDGLKKRWCRKQDSNL